MFDGVFEGYGVPPARPARPASIDTRAMLPMLRIQGSEATVEGLAYLVGLNALGAARWRVVTWPGEELADLNHPSHAAALDPTTPVGRFGEALALLADAITRHQALTGRDGLALARTALADHFNASFAADVLAPLENMRMDIAIEALINRPEPGDPPPPPPRQPTPSERRDAAGAVLELAWADGRLTGLAEALDRFHTAHQVDGGDAPGVATRAALAAVEAVLQGAGDQGVTQGGLEMVLSAWSTATGGPMIRLDGAAPV